METVMTPAEKAKVTRRQNQLKREQKAAEERQEKEVIRKGCLEILGADEVAPEQKLEVLRILHELMKK